MTPESMANEAIRTVLANVWAGVAAQRVDSPPGAGKTGLVERVAATLCGLMGRRCAVATSTNEQCFDLARRLTATFSKLTFTLFMSDKLTLPDDLRGRANLAVAHDVAGLPTGPCVVLANASKWSWIMGDVERFDLLVVDEAFQLPDYRFHLIAGIATKVLLVGDPGQIAPVIPCSVERWRGDPSGPHVPCPEALLERHPWVPTVRLPVSRRLVQDTVSVVQPAFYPELPFTAVAPQGSRGISFGAAGLTDTDRVLDLLAHGASLALAELAPRVTGEIDDEVAETLAAAVDRLFVRGARVRDGARERALRPADVGVVCAHVSQVNAVRARMKNGLVDVLVETAERFQGLEREVMFVHHPLSGRASLSSFQLDAGRLCVMTTRHRVACVLVARAGLDERLLQHAPAGERVLGRNRDDEHEGWRAHRTLIATLRAAGRCVPVGAQG